MAAKFGAAQNDIAEAGVWAAWKGGRLLRETERNKGTILGGNIVLQPGDEPTLEELNLSRMMAHRWQVISHCPDDSLRASCSAISGFGVVRRR